VALLINAAQGLGHVAVEVEALGAAFLAGTSHKWLGAGFAQGVLYAQREWLEGPLPLAGWLSVELRDLWHSMPCVERFDDARGFVATGARTRHEASALEVGAVPWVGLYGLHAALDLHESLGASAILQHNLALQRVLREALRARGFVPNAPDAPEVGSGICVVPVAGDANEVVRTLLREANIMTTARGGGLRLSTHYFNTEGDVQQLIDAVDRLGIRPG
jgi:selenocysteine lyase/cysteine desulfurase